MPAYGQDFLYGTIYGFFLCGKSIFETYREIKAITKEEIYDELDIGGFFEDFRSQSHQETLRRVVDAVKKDIGLNLPEEEETVLEKMPFPIQRNIILQTDLNSRLNLRKVSSKLENVVDIVPLHINTLTVSYNSEFIEICTDEGYLMGYCNTIIPGCIVRTTIEKVAKHEIIMGRQYYNCALEDLMNLLKFRNLSIGTIHFIRVDPLWHQRIYYYIIHEIELMLLNIVSNFKNSQKIGQFSFRSDLSFVIACLSGMNNSVCNRIIHTEFSDPHRGIGVGQEFYDSDIWKNLDCFVTNGTIFFSNNQGSLKSFTHFNRLKVALADPVTVGQIMDFKDMILHNSKLREIFLIVRWSDGELEKMNDLLGIRNIDLLNGPVFKHFPQGNKKKLSLSVGENWVVFRGPCFDEKNPLN